MAYCKYCGKELDKKGNCSCEESKKNDPKVELVKPEVVDDGASAPQKDKIKADGIGSNAKRYAIIAGVIAVAIIILLIAAKIVSVGNAYKEPIKSVIKGMNKADSQIMYEAIYTEDALAEMRVNAKNSDLTWADYLKQNNKKIDSKLDELGMKKAKFEIVGKEQIGGSNLEEIEDYYKNQYNVKVKKAYRVEVKFTFKTKGGTKETPTGWLTVVKLKGEGWKFAPNFSDNVYYLTDVVNIK